MTEGDSDERVFEKIFCITTAQHAGHMEKNETEQGMLSVFGTVCDPVSSILHTAGLFVYLS